MSAYTERITHAIDFAREAMEGRPMTHDFAHAAKVYRNAQNICFAEGADRKVRFYAEIIAILHDVCDHKYAADDAILRQFLSGVEDGAAICDAIAAVSYSYQKRHPNALETLPTEIALGCEIARCADRIEAVGNSGVIRCMRYAREIGKKNVVKHLRLHAAEKLSIVSQSVPYWLRPYIKNHEAEFNNLIRDDKFLAEQLVKMNVQIDSRADTN